MWVRAALGHSQFVRNKGGIEMAAASLTFSCKILNGVVLGSIFQFIHLSALVETFLPHSFSARKFTHNL
ncbi:hypothetical protein EA004_20450 [Vibrio anguillarum]|nr:hypothetical protein [Vibrio anguillarum]